MFPQADLTINSREEIDSFGRSYLFDFNKGDFALRDGRLVTIEGIEALRVWIDKILRTEKFRFSIYDDYGIKIEDLLGGVYDKSFLISELGREMKEALTRHPLILNITNVTIVNKMDLAIVSFDVITNKETFNKEVAIHV